MSSMLNPAISRSRFFELTSEEWALLFAAALLSAAGVAAVSPNVTTWSALGLGFTALVVGHLCLTARRFVAFPDLIVSASCLQWIVAPWLAAKYPSRMVVYHMTLPIDEYLSYAVPATIALWVGLHLPASRILSATWALPEIEPLSKPVRRTLDAAIVIGLIVEVYSEYVPSQLAFLGYLIASLRFVGALGWMITKTPGWMIRVLVVMLHFVATQSAGGGMFYLVVHWGGYFLLVYGFMKRWRMTMAMALIVGIMALGLLQTIKPTFRASLVEERPSGPVEAFTRLTSMLWERISEGHAFDPNADTGDTLVRFNQGWIIARIMTHVPAEEPYAAGQTLADAAIFTIVPRFLVPSKREGASTQLFFRFTGIKLPPNTRMGLGVIGELYANFGRLGGVLATLVYGGVMGWILLFFAVRAQKNPLWWAVAPAVLLPCVEPGFNVEDVTNHIVKGAVVFMIVWKLCPPVQRLLAPPADTPADEEFEDISPFDDVVTDH
jgi:hypothetical protein